MKTPKALSDFIEDWGGLLILLGFLFLMMLVIINLQAKWAAENPQAACYWIYQDCPP